LILQMPPPLSKVVEEHESDEDLQNRNGYGLIVKLHDICRYYEVEYVEEFL